MRTPLPNRCPSASMSLRSAGAGRGSRLGPSTAAWLGVGAVLALNVVPAYAVDPVDPQALELAWHRCLREATAHQPAGQSRAGNERNALDECKSREDALVAALMSGRRPEDGRSGTVWTRTWAAFVEPLTAWIGALRR